MLRALVAVSLSFASLLAQDHAQAKRLPTRGVSGERPGTEQWVVHLAQTPFDLERLRQAHAANRSTDAIERIVADLEQRCLEHQREPTAAARALGARVLYQWWIVDAFAIEIDPDRLPALADRADVVRLEPVRAVFPVIREATNGRNHAADHVQRNLGIHGNGVTVAVIDTGVDENMGGSGRPHRAFYPNGDANNRTGAGKNGSRLLLSRRVGLLGPDDPHNHGTGVASIAVGGGWGSSRADAGHADGADLVSYAIANEPVRGGTTTAVIAQAWQLLAADRAQYGIAVANLSYGGSPHPDAVDQMALDSAARNADVLVAVAAGNTGSTTVFSQGAANGIAVGAVTADSHRVASFSSRGPLFGSKRFYPDLAACGVDTVMAQRDAEALDYVASGTSMASPQVAGAAALVRSVAPGWSALETKAALLATSLDVTHRNPTEGRNAYGIGLLRDDAAVELAMSASGVAEANVDTTSPIWTRTFTAQRDRAYAFAVTWFRDPLLNHEWSDLDVEVIDTRNGNVIASSATPENLYEMARFVVRTDTTLTLRVSARTFQSGTSTQDFAWAWTEVGAASLSGSYARLGRGCEGSGPPATGRLCVQQNAAGPHAESTSKRGFEVAYECSAPTVDLRMVGFELHGRFEHFASGSTLTARVYAGDQSGVPGALLATGTLTGSASLGWLSATLATPIDVASGQTFFVAVDSPTSAGPGLRDAFQVQGRPFGWGLRVSGSSTWIAGSPLPFAVRIVCDTSSRPTIPSLTAASRPEIGAPLQIQMSQVAAGQPVALCTGVSQTTFGQFALPLDLTPFGAPQCLLRTSIDIVDSFAADSSGRVQASLLLPNDSNLVGRVFYQQAVVLDPVANGLGIALSNSASATVGGRFR